LASPGTGTTVELISMKRVRPLRVMRCSHFHGGRIVEQDLALVVGQYDAFIDVRDHRIHQWGELL